MKQTDVKEEKTQPSYPSHAKSIEEVSQHFQVDSKNGLTEKEAKRRLEEYGPNKLQEKKKVPFIIKFLKQFIEPMVIILLIAALISLAIFFINLAMGKKSDEWIDAIVILAIVIINALIGSIQEQKAEQSLEALKKLSTPMCTVKRGGKTVIIKSDEIVPGDVVILEEGTIVPADLRLIYSVDLKSDESSLTGESVPAEKDAKAILKEDTVTNDKSNMVFSSCPISYGRGIGIAVSTGMNTEVGKIATLLTNEEDDETPLQKKLSVLSKQLGIICLVIVIVTFLSGFVWAIINIATSSGDWSKLGWETLDLFEESIALAVAAIPEGLSAIVTIALALGVGKMVKVNTIVRKLPSVETLGSVTVVCSDKTGTLTQNKMTVKKVYINEKTRDADKLDIKEIALLATGMMLCSNASISGDRYGDPTELALLDYAKTFNILKEETEEKSQPRLDELPFDSVRKMMSVENSFEGKKIIYTKGALDSILKHTEYIEIDGVVRPITKEDIDKINKASKEMADEAYRVLAFAYRYHEEDSRMSEEHLIYVGMVGMIDPERKEAQPAVSKLKEAGIRTVMITGDHKDTAFAIAKNLGVADDIDQCCSGDELNALTEEQLREKVERTNVFARVSPENKVQIVKALKANGNIVSMTGDGVNDAPSLKAADIGIAMGITGTDVAKSAADMVLTDDNFASIEKAVEEGRGIFSNVKKAIFYLLSSNFGEVLTMFFVLLLGLPTPLATLQILWINLITDSLPAIALSMDKKDKDIMKQKPRNPKDGVFAHGGFKFTLGYGVVIFLITICAFFIPAFIHMGTYDFGTYNGLVANSDSWSWSWKGLINCLNSRVVLSDGSYAYVGIKHTAFTGHPEFSALFATEEELNAIQFTNGFISVHEQAMTFSFTVLAMSQIFHMIGMTDLRRSFIHVFKDGNWMLLISFILGFALQIAVTEIPFLSSAFKTTKLLFSEWMILAAMACVPLIVHEILAPIFRKKDIQII